MRAYIIAVLPESFFKEMTVGGHVLVVGIGACEGMSFVVEQDIERLGIGSELAALQVAPAVAHGAERDVCAVLLYDELLRKRRLFIDIKGRRSPRSTRSS